MFQESLDCWRLHEQIFDSEESARFAAAHWPELLKHHYKHVVSLNIRMSAHARMRTIRVRNRPGRLPVWIANQSAAVVGGR